MCKESPGPRCSSHAAATLAKAKENFDRFSTRLEEAKANNEPDAKQVRLTRSVGLAQKEVEVAQRRWYATPRGLQHLKKVGQEARDNGEDARFHAIEEEYRRAVETRERQKIAYEREQEKKQIRFKMRETLNQFPNRTGISTSEFHSSGTFEVTLDSRAKVSAEEMRKALDDNGLKKVEVNKLKDSFWQRPVADIDLERKERLESPDSFGLG